MSIVTQCPFCGKKGGIPVSWIEKNARCRQCKNIFRIGLKDVGIDSKGLSIQELDILRKLQTKQLVDIIRNPMVLDAFPVFKITAIEDDRTCNYCRRQDEKLMPTTSTLADLPPFIH